MRQGPAVLLPALFGATLEQTAAVLGAGRATVARLQTSFRNQGPAELNPARNWGGRRQSLLTPEEEVAFLKPWLESAATGHLVVVSPDSGGLGATPGPADQAVGGLSAFGPPGLAQGGTRHPPSQEPTRGSSGLEKKLPEVLETLLTPEVVKGRHVRLMFQDEARFGRMVRVGRCWAPAPPRPVVDNGYEREFQYVYGAVSPLEGELDWMICPAMNTERRGTFLAQVSAAHPQDFIILIVDGAGSPVAQALVGPENIRLHRWPGYSPELNPQEHLWDEVREKEFPKRVFSDLAGVVRTLETGLPRLASDRERVRSICAWPWMVSLTGGRNKRRANLRGSMRPSCGRDS